MSLEQEIEDTKAKLAEALEAEKEPEKVEEPVEVPEEKPIEEEKPKEEPKTEEKPDDSAFARLRRESAANKRRAEEAEAARDAALAKPTEVEEPVDAVAPELDSIIRDHRTARAEKEFKVFESQVRSSNPEYDAVTAEYAQALQGAIKIQNPRLSAPEIAELTKEALLQKAGKYARDGYANPVEELFHEAKELGFTGASFQQKEEAKETPQPDMKKLAENRKRSAGTAGTSGESKTDMNRASIIQNGMPTNEEWQRLTPSQKREILQSA